MTHHQDSLIYAGDRNRKNTPLKKARKERAFAVDNPSGQPIGQPKLIR